MAFARWHPVSERLPKLRNENLVVTVIAKGYRDVTTAYCDNEGCWHYAANGRKADVVAWMGLAPWEG